jgi:integrase
MGGTYYYHAPAKRYCVRLYWDGKDNRIWRYNGEPIWHEKTAEKLLSKIRAEIDDGRFILQSYFPNNPLSLKKFSEAWLNASTVCPATKKFYEKSSKKAIAYFGSDFDIRNFTHSKLQTFYNDLNLSIKGKYNILSALKTMLNFAVKDNLIPKLPPFPTLPMGLPEDIKYLTYEQQQTVLSHIPERHRPIFEFAMEYGLRIGEVTALKWDCVTDKEVIIRRSISNGKLRETTKTGSVRKYGLTQKGMGTITLLHRGVGGNFVFKRDERGTAYTRKVLSVAWRNACKRSGIHINLYNAFRHSLGCQLLDAGVDLEMVRDVLGHTSTNMTRRYAKRSQSRITEILEFRCRPVKQKSDPQTSQVADNIQ